MKDKDKNDAPISREFKRLRNCSRKRVDDTIEFYTTLPVDDWEEPQSKMFGWFFKKPIKKYFGIRWSVFDLTILFFGSLFGAFINAFIGNMSLFVVNLIIGLWISLCKWTETRSDHYWNLYYKQSKKHINTLNALAYMRAEYEDLYNNAATHKMFDK